MYTLEDVVSKSIYILCPEKWQRDAFIEYSENVLKDMGWSGIDYHEYGSKTYFQIDNLHAYNFDFEIENVHGDYITSYGEYYFGLVPCIKFEEFDMAVYEVDMNKFDDFLLGD